MSEDDDRRGRDEGDDAEAEDREAILRRRARFVAAALVGLGGLAAVGCDAHPQACLDIPPPGTNSSGASGPSATVGPSPTPTPSPTPAPTPEPMPCLSVAYDPDAGPPPMPCLAPPPSSQQPPVQDAGPAPTPPPTPPPRPCLSPMPCLSKPIPPKR